VAEIVSDLWVFKVRRYVPFGVGYAESVMTRGTKEDCEWMAEQWNTNYQTDTGWAEPWVEEKFDWPDWTKYSDLLD
jgi:hypothetical protein